MLDKEVKQINLNTQQADMEWDDFVATLPQDMTENDWKLFVEEYITTETIETSYQKCVETFWHAFRPHISKWVSKENHIIEAAERGYDVWIKKQLENLDKTTREHLVNKVNKHRITALHRAVADLHLNTIELLLRYGSNPDVQNKFDESPLHLAAARGSVIVVNMLLDSGANPKLLDIQANRPIHVAALRNQDGVVRRFLEYERDNVKKEERDNLIATGHHGDSLFMMTAECGHKEVLKVLKEFGIDVNKLSGSSGSRALQHFAREHNDKAIAALIAVGADVNLGETPPVVLAVANARRPTKSATETVAILIANGALTLPLVKFSERMDLTSYQQELCKLGQPDNIPSTHRSGFDMVAKK